MAITYFTSLSNPTDNNTLAGAPVSVTPPSPMSAGDLVVIVAQSRDGTAGPTHALSISTTGGQTWTTETQESNTTASCQTRIFWCTFNGTWTADPAVTVTTTGNALTVAIHVFRPTSGSNTWAVDVAQQTVQYAAPSGANTVTITGQTTVASSTVTFAVWASSDDNTWTDVTGVGWALTGSGQYRNLQGQDQSMSFGHFISTVANTATGNVSKNQATLGGDAGNTHIITFKEVAPAAAPAASTVTDTPGNVGPGVSYSGGALSF